MAAHHRLSLERILLRTFGSQTRGSNVMVEDHLALAAAYGAAHLEMAKATIKRHADRWRELGRQAVDAAGGSV